MKLKTLKDMKLNWRIEDPIREEAIKWAKYYQGCVKNTKCDFVRHHYIGCMEATMEQNNITKEDLK